MTAKAAVAEATPPPTPIIAPAESYRAPSAGAGAGACAGAGADAGASAERHRQTDGIEVLEEEEEEEEEEEDGEEEKAIQLAEMMGEFDVIEEERRDAEWMERVLHAAIVKTRKDVYGPLLKQIADCEKWMEGQAGRLKRLEGLEAGQGWSVLLEGDEGVLRRLRDKAAKALAVEESALAALAEASDKVAHCRRVQAAAGREIDELFLDAEEEKETARALAEHEAQERKHALLELERARDPAWERMPGGVGNLGWWKHVGEAFSGRRGDGGGGRVGGGGDAQSDGGAQSSGGGGDDAQSDGSGGGSHARVSPGRGGGGETRCAAHSSDIFAFTRSCILLA